MPGERRDLPLALALVLGVAVVVSAGVATSACSAKSDHPPQLAASPTGGVVIDNPVECADLFAASPELLPHVPGALYYDGGPAQCLVKGSLCPLRDTDAGVCDGGHDAATPGAQCEGTQWFGVCLGPDGG